MSNQGGFLGPSVEEQNMYQWECQCVHPECRGFLRVERLNDVLLFSTGDDSTAIPLVMMGEVIEALKSFSRRMMEKRE
ncbi:MAG: hypothetical protein Q7K03_10635 [Dehalococcoidia bacterium]|nr:hypothetical protein [Dehalococcoidia bacterium]